MAKSVKQKTEDAKKTIKSTIAPFIKAEFYTQSMVGKVATEHGITDAQARSAIAAVIEPLIADLENKKKK